MNICIGENLGMRRLDKLDDFLLNLDDATLIFLANKGVFELYDTNNMKGAPESKKKEYEDLKLKLAKKEREIEDFNLKISALDKKIANLEKVILQDDRERQYIRILGENHIKNNK